MTEILVVHKCTKQKMRWQLSKPGDYEIVNTYTDKVRCENCSELIRRDYTYIFFFKIDDKIEIHLASDDERQQIVEYVESNDGELLLELKFYDANSASYFQDVFQSASKTLKIRLINYGKENVMKLGNLLMKIEFRNETKDKTFNSEFYRVSKRRNTIFVEETFRDFNNNQLVIEKSRFNDFVKAVVSIVDAKELRLIREQLGD